MAFIITSCSSTVNEETVAKTLKKNPQLLFDIIEDNPEKFLATIQKAVRGQQKKAAELRAKKEEKVLLNAIDTPLKPVIAKDEVIRGPKDAPITIVEYSDFECSYCSKSKETISSLLAKYPDKVRVVFKHLPLSFHPAAMISAKYYEAISLQSSQKAFEFHDRVFKNQAGLKNGEPYLTRIAEDLKVDMVKLQKDLHSKLVKEKIQKDIAEAKKFNIQGTPGFLINGVPVKGAYPVEHFEKIISTLQEKGKLVL